MHLHSCYEVLGSMHGHCYQAKKYGLEAVWFTDHDTFMGARRASNGYNFEDGLISTAPETSIDDVLSKWMNLMHSLGEEPCEELWRSELIKHAVPPQQTGFAELSSNDTSIGSISIDSTDAFTGKKCMRMHIKPNKQKWQRIGVEFIAWKKRMNRSLISGVSVGLAVRVDEDFSKDSRLLFEFAFSQQPPDMKVSRLIYCIGNNEGLSDDNTIVLPLELNQNGIWQYIVLPLSVDSEKFLRGGLDNAFQNMKIVLESRYDKETTVRIDNLCISEKYHLQDLMLRQRVLGSMIGQEYGIKAYVTTEISMAGHHKNCFSDDVPIMDYPASDYCISNQEAVSFLKKHKAIFAYNHPFIEYINLPLTDVQREKIVEYEKKQLIGNNCFDAALIEVAFPEGRYGFGLKHYLKLWDALGLNGVFLTGYGDSDNHRCDERWEDGNNFAAYIYAENADNSSLCKGMLKGNLFSADPADSLRLVSFSASNELKIEMGSIVLIAKQKEVLLTAEFSGVRSGMTVKWISDGEEVKTETVCQNDGVNAFSFVYRLNRKIGLCRIEAYREDGRCILISNPIFFTNEKVIKQKTYERPIINLL